MAVPTKMTTHMLDALKGWPRPTALDFSAKISANVTVDPVPAGRVMHLNSVGELELGVSGTHMPLFVFPSSNDPDVSNDGGDPSTDDDLPWVAVGPTGVMMALVAVGAYELWTTEYVSASYAPNALLTAATGNGASAGKLVAGTISTDNICGVVSRGLISRHNKSVLAFWPVYLPAGI